MTSPLVLQETEKVLLTGNITTKWNLVDSTDSLLVAGSEISYQTGGSSQLKTLIKITSRKLRFNSTRSSNLHE